MDNPVQVTDLEARFRPLAGQEQAAAADLLADAWEVLHAQVSGLEERIESQQLREGAVKAVIKAMVLRVLRNPDAIRQFTSDDASYVRDNAVSTGLLYATPEELSMLTGISADPVGHLSFSGAYHWQPRRALDTPW